MSDGDVRGWVRDAVRGLGLTPAACRVCEEDEAVRLNDLVKRRFVRGSPRVWWLALKRVNDRSAYDSFDEERRQVNDRLASLGVARGDALWFFPDADDGGPLPAFEATLESVLLVLGDTPVFEYYLVGKGLDWLLASTDHNELLLCRAI